MDVPHIEYAPRPKYLGRGRPVKWVIGFLALTLLLPAGMKGIPLGWHHVQLLYWQQKSLNYLAPPDQVVLETDPAKTSGPGLTIRAYGAFRVAVPWDRFYSILSPPGRVALATLFVHERKNPAGQSRLVVIEAVPGPQGFVLDPIILHPGSFFTEPQETIDAWMNVTPFIAPSSTSAPAQFVRFFAGQPDPADPTHFTIVYQAGSGRFTVDGWLRDNDTIEFERHPTP